MVTFNHFITAQVVNSMNHIESLKQDIAPEMHSKFSECNAMLTRIEQTRNKADQQVLKYIEAINSDLNACAKQLDKEGLALAKSQIDEQIHKMAIMKNMIKERTGR